MDGHTAFSHISKKAAKASLGGFFIWINGSRLVLGAG
jgi:hypothetical protein